MWTASRIAGRDGATGVVVEEDLSELSCAVRGWIVGDAGVAGIEVLCVTDIEEVLRSAEDLEAVLEASFGCELPPTIMWC